LRFHTKLALGLMQRFLYRFVPRIGYLSIRAHVKKIATVLARISCDHQFNKRWDFPRTLSIRYRVLRQSGVVVKT
jgi:hypothetical protein